MEMVTYPWGDRSQSRAKRIKILCNTMALCGLPADKILADAERRARKQESAGRERDTLASCGCYHASPWPCSHRFCSCVTFFGTNHTEEHRREYFTAALVRLLREKQGKPATEFVERLRRKVRRTKLAFRVRKAWFKRSNDAS